jgi:poly(glycerol-phosphate) alpha-glucosyltransferase
VEDGVNGYIVPDGSNNTMAQKVVTLLSDDNLWSQMSTAAYEKAQAFADDKMTIMWQNVLK